MVLIWTPLANGNTSYCAILVAMNSLLQMVLYAPLSILFIKVISRSDTAITLSYSTVATSVGVFLGIPLGTALVTRAILLPISAEFFHKRFIPFIAPFSLVGLLYTIIVLFASQGANFVHQIVSVVRVAAPLIFLRHILLLSVVDQEAWVQLWAGCSAELDSCKQQLRAGHCGGGCDVWSEQRSGFGEYGGATCRGTGAISTGVLLEMDW